MGSAGQRAATKERKRALGERLENRFKAYCTAAGAAGVGLLALAQPAQADIVYTPADIFFRTGSSLPLDLNHDGTNDFLFENYADLGLGSTTFLIVRGLSPGDEIRVRNGLALPLPLGARIGPSGMFSGSATLADAYKGSGGGTWGRNRYLGLKFDLGGQTHYGWAELSVGLNKHGTITAKLAGYAYQTIPGKAIRAGQTQDDSTAAPDSLSPDDSGSGAALTNPIPDTPQPVSLGMLALGAQGVSLWRRKQPLGKTSEKN